MKRKLNCASGYRALKVSSDLEKFPFLKCASGNRALNLMGNFRETFGNFLETVRVVIGQESVRVGMWSPCNLLFFILNIKPFHLVRRFLYMDLMTKILG